jgi:hypothetical protein
MLVALYGFLIAAFVGLGVMVMLEAGRLFGRTRRSRGEEIGSGGAIEGAVFAIFGLLVAFTFSGAASRFEGRRALVTQEANAIGTAWLRLDLLPADHQPAVRDDLRRYVDARLATYVAIGNDEQRQREIKRAEGFQGEIWTKAIAAARAEGTPSTMTLVLPALNELFDLATTRMMATHDHPPLVIYIMLVALALTCAFLAGTGLAQDRPNRLHAYGFAVVMALTVYVILDLEFPRLGLIRIDAADQVLYDVRASMGPVSAL